MHSSLIGVYKHKDADKTRGNRLKLRAIFGFVAIPLQVSIRVILAKETGDLHVENFFVGKSGRKWSKYLLLHHIYWVTCRYESSHRRI